MNRDRFIKELERLLLDLPAGERNEALQYYNDYFDDAGPENEERVIRELGSPAQVAKTIREGASESGEYTEHGYEDARFRDPQEISPGYKRPAGEEASLQNRKSQNPWKLLCILLLCLLLFPVIVPLFLAFLAVVFAVFLIAAVILIGTVAAAVALPIAGIILIGFAFYNLFFLPGVGVALGGIGCLLLSAGIPIFLLAVWICKILIPVFIRGIVSLIRYPFRKAGILK